MKLVELTKPSNNRIRQGIAGMTLFVFLLTQLVRPLPVSARDTLRTEATSQSTGLEELDDKLQREKPASQSAATPPTIRMEEKGVTPHSFWNFRKTPIEMPTTRRSVPTGTSLPTPTKVAQLKATPLTTPIPPLAKKSVAAGLEATGGSSNRSRAQAAIGHFGSGFLPVGEEYTRREFLKDALIGLGSIGIASSGLGALLAYWGGIRQRRVKGIGVADIRLSVEEGRERVGVQELAVKSIPDSGQTDVVIEGKGTGSFNIVIDPKLFVRWNAQSLMKAMRRLGVGVVFDLDTQNVDKFVLADNRELTPTPEGIRVLIGVDEEGLRIMPDAAGGPELVGFPVQIAPADPQQSFQLIIRRTHFLVVAVAETRRGNIIKGATKGAIAGGLYGFLYGWLAIVDRAYQRLHAKEAPQPVVVKTKETKSLPQLASVPSRGILGKIANLMGYSLLMGLNNIVVYAASLSPTINELLSYLTDLPPAAGFQAYVSATLIGAALIFSLTYLTTFSLAEPLGLLSWARWLGYSTKDIKRRVNDVFEKLKQTASRKDDELLVRALSHIKGFDIYPSSGFKLVQETGKDARTGRLRVARDMIPSATALRYLMVRRGIGFEYDRRRDVVKSKLDLAERAALADMDYAFWLTYSDYETLKRSYYYPHLVPYILIHNTFVTTASLINLLFIILAHGVHPTFHVLRQLVRTFIFDEAVSPDGANQTAGLEEDLNERAEELGRSNPLMVTYGPAIVLEEPAGSTSMTRQEWLFRGGTATVAEVSAAVALVNGNQRLRIALVSGGMRGFALGRLLGWKWGGALLARSNQDVAPPAARLEEQRQAILSRMQKSLRALDRQAPEGIAPIIIGPLLQEMDSRYRFLSGLEEQGIYLDDGKDRVSLLSRIIAQHPEARLLHFAGLEEETRELLLLASHAGMVIKAAWPTHGLLSILSQMTGLEEAFLQTQADFQEFQAGLEAVSSGA